jgi:hypothetical protein
MIRHPRLALALAVLPLVGAVVESSCRALLMPSVGSAPLTEAPAAGTWGCNNAGRDRNRDIGKTTRGIRAESTSVVANHFAVRRHAGSQAVLDKGRDFVAGQNLSVSGDLTKVAIWNPVTSTAGFLPASRLRSHLTPNCDCRRSEG